MTHLFAKLAPESGAGNLLAVRPAAPAPNLTAGAADFRETLNLQAAESGVVDLPMSLGAPTVSLEPVKLTPVLAFASEVRPKQSTGDEDTFWIALSPGLAPEALPLVLSVPAPAELPRDASGVMGEIPQAGVTLSITQSEHPAAQIPVTRAAVTGAPTLQGEINAAATLRLTLEHPPTAEVLETGALNAVSMTESGNSASPERTPAVQSIQSQTLSLAVVDAMGASIPVAERQHGSVPEIRLAGHSQQPLAQALGERLHVQIDRRSEHAVIRLDPPSMGSIEIVVRHEAGSVQVHIRAANGEVLRQLHGISETLRQDLMQRHHGDVSVQISEAGREALRDGDGRQRYRQPDPEQESPRRALGENEDGRSAAFVMAHDRE